MAHLGTRSKKGNGTGIAVQTVLITAIVSDKQKCCLGGVSMGMGGGWQVGVSWERIPRMGIKLVFV